MRLSKGALSKTAAIIIAVVVVIAVIGGVAVLTRQPQPSPTPTPTSPSPTTATVVTTPTVTKKDTIKVAIGVDLDTVDPHAQTTTMVYNVLRHCYETLVWFDEKGNVIPWLAEKWEVSPDGKVYTFYIRKGVKFHDGSELDAYVVKANFDRWLDPTVRVPQRGQLGPIEKVEVVDKYTVKVYMKTPYAVFLRALGAYLLITSSGVITSFGNKTITEVIGTGPYKFVAWEKGKRIVIERFDDYWGEKPVLKRIEWLVIPEASTRLAALLAGDVDFAFNLPPTDLERVKGDARFTVLTPTSNRIIFVAMIPRGPLADPKVRQALNYAVDVDSIIKNVLYGLGIKTNAPLPPHFFGYADMPPYTYNPEKAKQLLAEAGYPQGFKVVLMHPTGRYLMDKQVAEAIQAYLSKVGITVELKTMDWPSFVAELLKPLDQKTFDMVLLGWGPAVADAHFTLYGQFHSAQATPKGLAAAHYNNSEVDKLLEAALAELNESKRAEYYKKAIEIIWRDAPWIFLYTQKWFFASSASLEGYKVHIDGEQVYFWKAYVK
ncbi:MAG: ABC transporter substrate-binding protein [Desulfurococcaceae archaeon]|jgi:peptide/nickel transport system substrate-binding protein|nr:ABC transporter substrate-binding protein [Desulfurococcaceae archaeon]